MHDLIQSTKNKKINIVLPSHLWHKIDTKVLNIIQTNEWKVFKFYEANKTSSKCLDAISKDRGGIYIFYINPCLFKYDSRLLMYVGRARKTSRQNLHKRISEYYSYAPPNYQRPKIANMLSEWGDDIFCAYLELNCSNEQIDFIEKELINNLLPYCNDAIPDKNIGRAVKAAGLQ